MKSELLSELKKCAKIEETKGGCNFSGGCICKFCAAPALIFKMITGKTNDSSYECALFYFLEATEYLGENS